MHTEAVVVSIMGAPFSGSGWGGLELAADVVQADAERDAG